MKYQIDQSGKVEQTEKNTVIACTNGKTVAVILLAKDKRRLQETFRRIGMPQLFIDTVFSVCLYLLTKQLSISKIEVDTEYPSHTKIIEKMIGQLSGEKVIINWIRVGKSSKAHDIAYKIYKKKIILGKKITAEAVWREAKKLAGGHLKTGLSPANRRSAPAIGHNLSKKKGKVK